MPRLAARALRARCVSLRAINNTVEVQHDSLGLDSIVIFRVTLHKPNRPLSSHHSGARCTGCDQQHQQHFLGPVAGYVLQAMLHSPIQGSPYHSPPNGAVVLGSMPTAQYVNSRQRRRGGGLLLSGSVGRHLGIPQEVRHRMKPIERQMLCAVSCIIVNTQSCRLPQVSCFGLRRNRFSRNPRQAGRTFCSSSSSMRRTCCTRQCMGDRRT